MIKRYLCLRLFALGIFCGVIGAQILAAVETLESSTLRIEVNSSPYSYRVIERTTGEVLVAQCATAFRFEDELYPIQDATGFSKSANTLQVTLLPQLSGRADLPKGVPAKAQVTFTFVRPEVVQVLVTYKDGNPGEVLEEFRDQGEHYYGIWEYPFGGNIDDRGADREFLGQRPQRNVNYSNGRAPFYATSKKYGIYVESMTEGHFSIAQAGSTQFYFRAPQLKYDIIYGPSYGEIFNRYNAIAGPAFMPPDWALGSIWWRDDAHEDLRDATNAQEKVMQDADRLRSLHIPASAMWLDRPYGTGDTGWGNMDFDSSFPDPPKMIRDLHDRGMNLMLWIGNRTAGKLLEEGTAKGYLLLPHSWPAADMRNPEAYKWFQDNLDAYVHLGIKGYKIDRGDEKEIPTSVENLNAMLFPKMAAEGLSRAYGNDYFVFSRNANDTARKYTALWSGDPWTSFSSLQTAVKSGLRAGAIDFPMWGTDTGSYFAVPSKELFARWFEFSAFTPMLEVLIGPKRTVWYDYDDELVGIARKYVTMHHDLIPYTRSYLYHATQTGMPVMRALAFAYPKDASLYDTWDEYLYGDEILVAPVTVEGATSRSVYLPEGRWIDYNDRATIYTGAKSVTVAAKLGEVPLFVREGAIIPRGDILKANNNWQPDWAPKLHIEVFPARNSSTQFDYYTGSSVKKVAVVPGKDGITIDVGDLGTPGIFEIYCRNVHDVTRNGTPLRKDVDYQYDAAAKKLTVVFTGATQLKIDNAASIF